MKFLCLIVLLFTLACSTTETKSSPVKAEETADVSPAPVPVQAVVEETKVEEAPNPVTPVVEETKVEEVPVVKTAEQEVKKVEAIEEKAVTQVQVVEQEMKKELPEIKAPEVTVEKVVKIEKEVMPEKAEDEKQIASITPPTTELGLSTPLKKPKPRKEIVPKPEKLLKVKGYKKLFKYENSADSKNYIYASKLNTVEVDGETLLKIKLTVDGLYINLPIARKLKSGKFIVTAIVTLNNRTSKLEFTVLSAKKPVDFALSEASLKQF